MKLKTTIKEQNLLYAKELNLFFCGWHFYNPIIVIAI